MGIDWGGLGSVATAGMGFAKKGIDNYQDLQNNQLTDQMANTKSQLAGDEPGSNLAHANHPVWDFISKLGGGNQPAPAPNGMLPSQGTPGGSMLQGIPTQFPAAQMGAPIAPAPSPVMQMAQGGMVHGDYGFPTRYPEFTQGPMQGIVPASTRGQILTMADGGYVPGAEISVPMNGRGAAAIAGLQAGQNIGHNFQQQWQDNEARQRAGLDAANTQVYSVDNVDKDGKPIPYTPPESAMGKATDAVEGFFKHIYDHTLGHKDIPNKDQPGAQGAIATNDPTQAGNQLNAPGTVDPINAGSRIFPPSGQPVAAPFSQGSPGNPLGSAPAASPLQSSNAPPPGTVAATPAGPQKPPLRNPQLAQTQASLAQTIRDQIDQGNDSLSTMGFPPALIKKLADSANITDTTKITKEQAMGLAGQALEVDSASRHGVLPGGAVSGGAAPDASVPPGGIATANPSAGGAPAGAPAPGPAPAAAPGPAGAAAAPGGTPASQPSGAAAAAPGTPAAAAAAAQGAGNTTAATGSGAAGIETKDNLKPPVTADGGPHSWKAQWWADSNRKLADAAYYGGKAGQDPWKILASGEAQRTGEVLRQTAGAVNAYQSGDMAGVARHLHNINFYLPDGKGIEVSYATADQAKADPTLKEGDLIHSNPYKGLYGHEKDQDWIKVDLPYLMSLGHGALDSDLMQKTLVERYAAGAKAEAEIRTGRGAELRGQGINFSGSAAAVKADDERALLPYTAEKLQSEAGRNLSEAGKADRSPIAPLGPNGVPKISFSNFQSLKNHASTLADSLQVGQKTMVPLMVDDPKGTKNADGTPKQVRNQDPRRGKIAVDQSKIPPIMRGITPEDRPRVNALAGDIYGYNPGRISDYDAVDTAARINRDERAKPADRVHKNPDTGKPERNVINYPDGRVSVWIGPKARDYRTVYRHAPQTVDYGSPQQAVPTGSSAAGDSGGAEEPDNTSALDASSGP